MKPRIGVILPFIFLGYNAQAADKPVAKEPYSEQSLRNDPEVLETKDVVVRTNLGSCECVCDNSNVQAYSATTNAR
jgi:hypothetical protein